MAEGWAEFHGEDVDEAWVDQEADVSASTVTVSPPRYDVRITTARTLEWVGPWAVDQMEVIEKLARDSFTNGLKAGLRHADPDKYRDVEGTPYTAEDYGK